MELEGEVLLSELETCSRETNTSWLQWNDPNGIYSDELSLKELGSIMSRKEGIEIIIRQIDEDRNDVLHSQQIL